MIFPNFNDDYVYTSEKNKSFDFPSKPKEINIKNNNILNLSGEDSIIFVENLDIEMLAINEENNKKKIELKETLGHIFEGFLEKYDKKEYLELTTEIETKEDLFYKNSLESFKIYILKIKSIIKLMIRDYYEALVKDNNTSNNIVKEYSNRIISEFKKLNILINKNSNYENEIITQVYSKFLIFLILYEERKENRLKSLGYTILGLNMMKIFFVKKKIGTDIKTYLIYMKLILLFINHLISDQNLKGALYYINFGFKLLDIIFKFIKFWNLPNKYYIKAIDFTSFNYIYCGICLEHNSINLKLSIDSFRQANYFLEKNNLKNNYSPFSSIFKNRNNRLKYENIFYLVSNSTIKLIKNELKKIEKGQELMMLKTNQQKEKEEKLNQNINEKNEKLKLISKGLPTNYKKFFPIQEKIYNKVLTQKITDDIEKTNKELVDYAYNKKKNNNNISNETKLNLCKFEIYNDLISEKFREFIVKNEQLKFNDPSKISDNLKKIRKYLRINDKDCQKNNFEEYKSFNLREKNKNRPNLNYLNKSKKNKNYSKTYTFLNIKPKESISYKRFNSINSYNNKHRIINIKSKKNLFNNNIRIDINNIISINTNNNKANINKRKNIKSKSFKLFMKTYNNFSKAKITKNNNNKNRNNNYNLNLSKKFHSYDFKLENDFEKKYLDKYLTTKNYQNCYFNYEKMIKKELNFQKYFLNAKNFNSQQYFDDYQSELTSIEANMNERKYLSKEGKSF